MLELIGWFGSVVFAICAAPQAYKSFKDKHSNGLSSLFLILWWVGEIATLIYAIFGIGLTNGALPLIINYVVNMIFLVIITFYKIKGHKQ